MTKRQHLRNIVSMVKYGNGATHMLSIVLFLMCLNMETNITAEPLQRAYHTVVENTDEVSGSIVFLGATVTLRCVQLSLGNPTALSDVQWYHNNKRITQFRSKYFIIDANKRRLQIDNVNKHDSGSYKCHLDNGVEASGGDTELNLTVSYPPSTPYVDTHGQSVYDVDTLVMLTCVTDDPGYPAAHLYIWLDDKLNHLADTHTPNYEFTQSHGGQLLVRCYIENDYGISDYSESKRITFRDFRLATIMEIDKSTSELGWTEKTEPKFVFVPTSQSMAASANIPTDISENNGTTVRSIAIIVTLSLVTIIIIITSIYYRHSNICEPRAIAEKALPPPVFRQVLRTRSTSIDLQTTEKLATSDSTRNKHKIVFGIF